MPIKIYRRGSVWHYRGTVAHRRLRGSTGATDKAIASRVAAEIEQRHWKGHLDGPASVLTFAQAAILYRAAGKSTRFLDKVEDHWKDTLVQHITPGAIRQAAIDIYPAVSAATRNRQAIVPTVAIINHAADSELCPHIKVKRFKMDVKIKTPATLEWVETFMKHASPRMGAMALFMFLTGARISEAIRLRWDDVDLEKRQALIRQTKQRDERLAHLPQPLVVALANLPHDDLPVFGYQNRGGGTVEAWERVCKRAGIQYLSFHCCRHGFATALLKAGIDVVTVARLGGWKTAKLVLETYGHATDDPTLTDRIFDTPLTHPMSAKVASPRKQRSSVKQ
jgi:integrase